MHLTLKSVMNCINKQKNGRSIQSKKKKTFTTHVLENAFLGPQGKKMLVPVLEIQKKYIRADGVR